MFLFDPEKVHHLVFSLIKITFKLPGIHLITKLICTPNESRLIIHKMGRKFLNPVGLAAGFDKDAMLFNELSAFGFSFIEIGTLTPLSQPGNDKPRMFRLPAVKGLINRMGFNNCGVDEAAKRLRKRNKDVIIGGNIGKNKNTPNDKAKDDYIYCFNALFNLVDYFALNVSSPNTQGLRGLQEKEPLTDLIKSIQKINNEKKNPKPVLLKIAPDLSLEQIDEIISIVKSEGIAGIIATNTTISRTGSGTDKFASESGGLSGLPLRDKATEVIRYLRKTAGKELIIIGVGGIFNADDARQKLDAGADLVQVYTGFIYEGPLMVKRICKGL